MTAVAVKINLNMVDEGYSYVGVAFCSPREVDEVVVFGSNRVGE